MKIDEKIRKYKDNLIGNIEEGLIDLKKIVISDSENHNMLLNFQSRIKRIKKDMNNGVIDYDTFNIEYNKIIIGILGLIDSLQNEDLELTEEKPTHPVNTMALKLKRNKYMKSNQYVKDRSKSTKKIYNLIKTKLKNANNLLKLEYKVKNFSTTTTSRFVIVIGGISINIISNKESLDDVEDRLVIGLWDCDITDTNIKPNKSFYISQSDFAPMVTVRKVLKWKNRQKLIGLGFSEEEISELFCQLMLDKISLLNNKKS